MKKGDVVTFSEVKDKGDENAVMVLEENPDGGRVLVRHLIDMNLQPTSIYPVSELELAFGVSSEDVFLAVNRLGADISMADADELFLALDSKDRVRIAKCALDAGTDMGMQTLAAQEAVVAILTEKKLLDSSKDEKRLMVRAAVVFAEPNWSFAIHAQSEDRERRNGRKYAGTDSATNVTVPTLEESIERIKREVIADVRSGKVPATVKSFSELHDYVDANCYGGFCEDGVLADMIRHFGGRDENEGMPDEMMEYLNGAQNAIDAWIKSDGVQTALQQGEQLRIDGPCSSGVMP